MENFYDILGVGRNASKEEIKKAYINELRKYHPDVTKFDKLYSEERSKTIIEAFEVLNNDEKRAAYDELLTHYYELRNSSASTKKHTTCAESDKKRNDVPPPSENNNAKLNYASKINHKLLFVSTAIIICVIGGLLLGKDTSNPKDSVSTKKRIVIVNPAVNTERPKQDSKMEIQDPKPAFSDNTTQNNTPVIKHNKNNEFIPKEPYNKSAKKIEVLEDFVIGEYRIGMPIQSPSSLESVLGKVVNIKHDKYSEFIVTRVEYEYGSIVINAVGNLSAMNVFNNSNKMATSRGIKLGSSSKDVLSAYGKPGSRSKDNLYTYPGGDGSEIFFKIENGKVVVMGFYYPYC